MQRKKNYQNRVSLQWVVVAAAAAAAAAAPGWLKEEIRSIALIIRIGCN